MLPIRFLPSCQSLTIIVNCQARPSHLHLIQTGSTGLHSKMEVDSTLSFLGNTASHRTLWCHRISAHSSTTPFPYQISAVLSTISTMSPRAHFQKRTP